MWLSGYWSSAGKSPLKLQSLWKKLSNWPVKSEIEGSKCRECQSVFTETENKNYLRFGGMEKERFVQVGGAPGMLAAFQAGTCAKGCIKYRNWWN